MEEERCYTVYMHVNKSNLKIYIGITYQEVERRWRSNGNGYKNQVFYNAIQKYGWDNFEHIILFENKTKEEAEELEILFIKTLMSNNCAYGYNVSNGGNSTGKISEDTKVKISKANKGRKCSKETIEKYKERWNKYPHPSSKKVFCDNKIFKNGKECARFYGINPKVLGNWLRGRDGMPQEYFDVGLCYVGEQDKVKLRYEQIGGDSSNAKKVICDGIIYSTLSEVSDKYNIANSTISQWLTGKRPMPQKFIDLGLKYLDSDLIFQPQKGYKGKNNPTSKKVICDEIIYNCIRECAEHYGVGRRLLNDWLLNPHRMPQEFKDIGLDYYIEEDI